MVMPRFMAALTISGLQDTCIRRLGLRQALAMHTWPPEHALFELQAVSGGDLGAVGREIAWMFRNDK